MDPAAAAVTGEWQGGLAASVQSRVSRWSDAPPPGAPDPRGHGSSALEPPFKKVRNDPPTEPDASNPPYAEGPPGLPYPASGAPAPSYGGAAGYGGTGGYVPAQSASFQSYGGGSQSQTSVGFAPGSAKANGALFYKTKLCTKFKIGACTFNERCHFAHGTEELRRPPPVGLDSMMPGPGGSTGGLPGGSFTANSGQPKKTRLCRYYAEGRCTYGDQCNFSHGSEDVPQRTPGMDFGGAGNTGAMGMGARATTASRPNYKTRLCTRWEKGEACEYGDRCHFAHGPAELQKSDGATYPNGSSVTGDMQYQFANSALPAPPTYGDPNMMNPPAYAANYGATASVGAPVSGVAPNPSSYGSSGVNTNPYGTSEGVNGASANYNYWNQEKSWEGAVPAYRPPSNPTQGYMQTSQPPIQANQMAPWSGGYSADGSYVKREGDTGVSAYPQEPQQQLQLQQQPQQQLHNTAGYPRSSQDYQDPKQSMNLPHVQNDGQSPYQVGARNGDGAYYNNTYNYPNQPADYTMRYNMAEAWGGKM